MLAQYPAVADADNINPIPRFSLRSPGSFIQLLLVLFCKTLEAMFGEYAAKTVSLVDDFSEILNSELSSSFI